MVTGNLIILSYPNSYPTLTSVKETMNQTRLMNPVIHYIPNLVIAIAPYCYADMR